MFRSLAYLLVLAAGCSASVPTSSLAPLLGVTADGHQSIFVSAGLYDLASPIRNGRHEPYMLGDGESWVATLADQSRSLELSPGTAFYTNYFAVDPVAGDQVVMALHRRDAEDASQSVFTFPQSLRVSAPATASRATELTIAWSPNGLPDLMSWRLSSDCIPLDDTDSHDIAGDPGMLTFPANTFRTVATTDACDLTIEVTRLRAAVLDPHFDTSSAAAYAAQSVTFKVTTTR